MSTRSRPYHVARSGSVSVPVYRESGPPVVFRVAWREGDRRQRRAFADPEEAKRFADARAQALANHGSAVLTLFGAELDAYRFLIAQADRFRVSVQSVVGEWSRASALLGQAGRLEEAAAHFTKHVRVTSEKPVEEAVAEFVASRETAVRLTTASDTGFTTATSARWTACNTRSRSCTSAKSLGACDSIASLIFSVTRNPASFSRLSISPQTGLG